MFLLELLNPRPEPSDQSPLTFHKPWPSFGRVSLIQSLPSPRGFTNLLSTHRVSNASAIFHVQCPCASSGSAQKKSCSTFPPNRGLHHIASPVPVAARPSQCICLVRKCSLDQAWTMFWIGFNSVLKLSALQGQSDQSIHPHTVVSSHYSCLNCYSYCPLFTRHI